VTTGRPALERAVSEDAGEQLVCRPLSVRLAASTIGVLFTAVVLGITSAALPSGIGGAVAVAAIPLSIVAFLRGFRISLVADVNAIVVRNYFRTHRVRWEEIEAIGVGFHGMGGTPLDAVVISQRGRRAVVTAQATTSSSRERRRVLRALQTMRPELPIRFSESI